MCHFSATKNSEVWHMGEMTCKCLIWSHLIYLKNVAIDIYIYIYIYIWKRAKVQYSGPRPVECQEHCTMFANILWDLFTIPFCLEFLALVTSEEKLSSTSSWLNNWDVASSPWSHLTLWYFVEYLNLCKTLLKSRGGCFELVTYIHIYLVLWSITNK